jgi:hypothetical protein
MSIYFGRDLTIFLKIPSMLAPSFRRHFEYDAGQIIKIPVSLFTYSSLALIWHHSQLRTTLLKIFKYAQFKPWRMIAHRADASLACIRDCI